MADLDFPVSLKWRGYGRDGEGQAQLSQETVRYSAPESMGGKGVGTSPEDLLIAAVASCYSGTLFRIVDKEGLPIQDLSIRAVGTVTGHPLSSKFARLTVHPTIIGGDATKADAYRQLALKARDKCFIGKTIAGNVEYVVGDVNISES